MSEMAQKFRGQNGTVGRALKQATRELFLAQSSDWAFILHTGTVVPYAVKRTKEHLINFTRIYDDLMNNRLDEGWLRELEAKDNVFPDVDQGVF